MGIVFSQNALDSVAAMLANPSRERSEEEKAYDAAVKSAEALILPEGHKQKPIDAHSLKYKPKRIYAITTYAASARYGGKRTVGVFDWRMAKRIVEKNAGDIFETTYRLAVIEGLFKNWLYGGHGYIEEAYWYLWVGDYETGKYHAISTPPQFEGAVGHGIG